MRGDQRLLVDRCKQTMRSSDPKNSTEGFLDQHNLFGGFSVGISGGDPKKNNKDSPFTTSFPGIIQVVVHVLKMC